MRNTSDFNLISSAWQKVKGIANILSSLWKSKKKPAIDSTKERTESFERKWQVKWREALAEPIDNLSDVDCDSVLHFDIWQLDDQRLKSCFGLFPNGEKILEIGLKSRPCLRVESK